MSVNPQFHLCARVRKRRIRRHRDRHVIAYALNVHNGLRRMFLEERATKVSDHTGYITIMSRRRFFVNQVRKGQAELEGDEARHLTQVLRVEAGQRYEISDNERVYLAEV